MHDAWHGACTVKRPDIPGMTHRRRTFMADRMSLASQGVVSLTGSVRSQEQVAIAAHAQREDGLMRIDNHLALNAQ
jgi:hypothetical protein